MEAKLLKTTHYEYDRAIWSGKNESGITPIGDRVVILPDTVAEQTTGRIFLDPRAIERGTEAAESGILVECGDDAFAWNTDRTRPFSGRKPKPGDRVCFEKYGGQKKLGKDGKVYRLADDKVIAGIED